MSGLFIVEQKLTLLFLIFFLSIVNCNHCGHDDSEQEIYRNDRVKPVSYVDLEQRRLLSSSDDEPFDEFKPLRISYDASRLYSHWNDLEFTNYFVDEVIPAAVEYLQTIFNVRPVVGRLRFERHCNSWLDKSQNVCEMLDIYRSNQCGPWVTMDDELFDELIVCSSDESSDVCTKIAKGRGVSADIKLYFTGKNAKNCHHVYAFSAYCHSNYFDRPIAGYINICEETLLSEGHLFTWEKAVTLVVHEAFHVLGFSSQGFLHFRKNDPQRTPRSPRNPRTRKPVRGHYGSDTIQTHFIRGKSARFITLPTVVRKAKEFFNCSTAIGVELEDYGGSSTASSHWEQRILMVEVMISYISSAAPLSIFTFALFADSGWYEMNWKYASETPYGRHKGCAWFQQKCILPAEGMESYEDSEERTTSDDSMFCTQSTQVKYGCSVNYVVKSNCKIKEQKHLPSEFQYFSPQQPSISGVLQYPDYCPMMLHYSNGDCRIDSASHAYSSFGGNVCHNCKCTLMVREETDTQFAICYEHQCIRNANNDWNGIRIKIRNKIKYEWITCWANESKQIKDNSLYTHDVVCPQFTDICYDDNPWMCNGHGMYDRRNGGLCTCNPGYIGCECAMVNRTLNVERDDDECKMGFVYQSTIICKSDYKLCFKREIQMGHKTYLRIADEYDVNGGHLNITFHVSSITSFTGNLYHWMQALKLWIAIPYKIALDDVWLDHYHQNSEIAVFSIKYFDDSGLAKTKPSGIELYSEMDSIYEQLFNDFSNIYSLPSQQHDSSYSSATNVHYYELNSIKEPDFANHMQLSLVLNLIIFSCMSTFFF